jgi:hypothetical protein
LTCRNRISYCGCTRIWICVQKWWETHLVMSAAWWGCHFLKIWWQWITPSPLLMGECCLSRSCRYCSGKAELWWVTGYRGILCRCRRVNHLTRNSGVCWSYVRASRLARLKWRSSTSLTGSTAFWTATLLYSQLTLNLDQNTVTMRHANASNH